MELLFLTLEDLLTSHAEQIANYGGTSGVRDIGLLESAIAQPQTQFDGKYLHDDLFAMAAAYLFHWVMNHPFVDGNKRVGLEAALVFLEINGVSMNATDEELVELVLATTRNAIAKPATASFFRSHAQ